MSGLPHVDSIKKHFVSGEPGTTGREPFEDSTSSGPGANFTSGGATTGAGLTGQHGLGHDNHNQHGLGHDNNNRGVDHLTAGSGLSSHDNHNHSSTLGNNHSSTHGNNATGLNTHNNTSGVNNNGKESLVDKVKDALPGVDGPNDKARKSDALGTSEGYAQPGNTGYANNTHDTSLLHDHQHGAGTAYGAGKHGTDHTSGEKVGLGGGLLSGAAGGPATAVNSGEGHRDHGDRVGIMGQDSNKYEGSLNHGPRTGGAAGTEIGDRSGSSHIGSSHTGAGVGSGLDRHHNEGVHQDTSQRAPGEKSGGLSGLLATSDKDFTGRERQGKGAYADTDGNHELNTTGPAGNSALTGREGDLSKNPVAQSKSHGVDSTAHGANTTGTHGTHGATTEPEHKGFLAKVKDAIL